MGPMGWLRGLAQKIFASRIKENERGRRTKIPMKRFAPTLSSSVTAMNLDWVVQIIQIC